MSAYIMCLTAGGVPIFNRNKGKFDNLSFSVIGSLNGVHMFSKSQQLELKNTETEDYKIVWKEFHDSLTLVGICSSCSTQVLSELLDSVFNLIVLIVGLDEVKSQKNAERLKRELRVVFPVIDKLLNCLDVSDTSNKGPSELVKMVEVILCTENNLLEVVLDAYSECVDSMFCCILINGKLAVATEQWWSLDCDEIKLLAMVADTDSSSGSVDLPVFLPYRSPNVAFRFVALSLMQDIKVCCLCGPTPLLPDIQHSAVQCFKNSIDYLSSASQCVGRNFPQTLNLDTGILGVLLINYKVGKYMASQNPHQSTSKRNNSGHRIDILKTFYYQSVMKFLIPPPPPLISDKDDKQKHVHKDEPCSDGSLNGKETYWCSEYHKCHAVRDDSNVLCVLYKSSVPTHAMRFLTFNTMRLLINDKQTCW